MAKPELRDHRKFLKLKRLLGEPVPHLIGYLECLWIRGYQTGSPIIGDELDVEAAAEYPGEQGRFTKAAVAAGFIDVDGSGNYSIHDLFQHAPKYVQLRMVRKKTAPEGTTWESVTGRKGKPKTEKTSTDELQNGKDEYERTAKPSRKPKTNPKDKNLEPRTKNQEPKAKNLEPKASNSSAFLADAAAPAEGDEDPKSKLYRPIFSAVAEVTRLDPQTASTLIGKVSRTLRDVEPPYTPEEIRQFAADYGQHCPWGPENGRTWPEPMELVTHIGKVRAGPIPPAGSANSLAKPPPKSFRQTDRDDAAAMEAALKAHAIDAPGRLAELPAGNLSGVLA